jgi:hypothetical protein
MHEIAIPLAGIALPLFLVPTIIAMRHVGRKREWEHIERMKAMEMGLPVPGAEPWSASVCMAIGAGVPAAAFFFTWLSYVQAPRHGDIFLAPTLVGIAAVFVARSLALKLLTPRQPQSQSQLAGGSYRNGKPAHDPDAFDVVGRRG